jgi:hypothetical protein
MCSPGRMHLFSQGEKVRLMTGPIFLGCRGSDQVGVKPTPLCARVYFTKIDLVGPGQAWGD